MLFLISILPGFLHLTVKGPNSPSFGLSDNLHSRVTPDLRISVPSNVTSVKGDQRVQIYPFTQYGPNNQLLGTIQALSLCAVLSIGCLEPNFVPHFTDAAHDKSVPFSKLFETGYTPFIPRSDEVIQLDYIITTNIRSAPCWPRKRYWDNHGIKHFNYGEHPGRVIMLNRTKRSRLQMEHLVLETLQSISGTGREQNITIGYVYCDVFGRPEPDSPLLKPSFKSFSQLVVPSVHYQRLADAAMESLGLSSRTYAAIHLRLKDKCFESFANCCCGGHKGSGQQLDAVELQKAVELLRSNMGLDSIFIASQPIFQNMTQHWTWFEKLGVKTWFADATLGSFEESIVQQLICSRAHVFVGSIDSTWSDTVRNWGSHDLISSSFSSLLKV